MDNRLENLEIVEKPEVEERDLWELLPWYYRVALHIANYLVPYMILVFGLGFFTGFIFSEKGL